MADAGEAATDAPPFGGTRGGRPPPLPPILDRPPLLMHHGAVRSSWTVYADAAHYFVILGPMSSGGGGHWPTAMSTSTKGSRGGPWLASRMSTRTGGRVPLGSTQQISTRNWCVWGRLCGRGGSSVT